MELAAPNKEKVIQLAGWGMLDVPKQRQKAETPPGRRAPVHPWTSQLDNADQPALVIQRKQYRYILHGVLGLFQ